MSDILNDRQEMGMSGDSLPASGTSTGGEKSRNFERMAMVGGAAALLGAIVGLGFGYTSFHSKAAPASAAGKPTGSNVGNTIGNYTPPGASPLPTTGAATLAQQQAPNGLKLDVNGNPIPANQTAMQGGSAGAPSPAMQRATEAHTLAAGERRSPIMAFSGGGVMQPGQGSQGQIGVQAGYTQAGYALGDASGPGGGGQIGGGFTTSRQNGFGNTPQRAGVSNVDTGSSDFSGQLAHSAIETVRATVVGNRSFLLSAGTLIPCTLQTAINSTQAGFVSCVVNHDVYSEDGRVVLLDKGTKVLGQYSGGLQQGQARLFVVWTRALTPRGVAIDLGSPATDELGRAGMAGGVDTQFWQRFGGALMLSVIEDAMDVVGRAVASYGSNTTQVPSSTAQVALQNSINVRPILKKNQGDLASIFVAKDFDFSSVYSVRLRR